jgi:hypothetical protein
MSYFGKSFSPQHHMNRYGSPWDTEKVIEYILNETKYFMTGSVKHLRGEAKTKFNLNKSSNPLMVVEVQTIELLKENKNSSLHLVLNKGTNPIDITISLTSFINSGLYMDVQSAIEDYKEIMTDVANRKAQYQHNLNRTTKRLQSIKSVGASLIDSYPELFI